MRQQLNTVRLASRFGSNLLALLTGGFLALSAFAFGFRTATTIGMYTGAAVVLAGHGINTALWVCFAIPAAGALASGYIFILGRAKLQPPDLDKWDQGDEPAWDSPPLAAGIRLPAPPPRRARPRAAG
jgi:hypothetical protein